MDTTSAKVQAILLTIKAIPEGRLSSYGHIAKAAGYPGNARLVGQILKWTPENATIPWFRVVNAQGKISFPEGSEDYKRQAKALIKEGHPKSMGKPYLNSKIWP